MNQLKTTINGGFPIVLDDLRWMDAAYRSAITGILSPLGSDAFNVIIISGCARSGVSSTVTIAAGYVLMNGEIFKVSAHSFTLAAYEYWNIEETYDAAGTKVFADAVSNDTYLIRQAKVQPSAVALPGLIKFVESLHYLRVLRDAIDYNSWQTLINLVVPGGGSVTPGTYTVGYKIDAAGFVHFRGQFPYEDPGAGAVNILVATLPVGARPVQKMRYVVSTGMIAGGSTSFAQIEVYTNGEVRIKTAHGAYVIYCEFSQIAPFAAV